jgi:hypothetical protein
LSFLGFAVVEIKTHILQGLTASTANFNLQLRAGHRQWVNVSSLIRNEKVLCSIHLSGTNRFNGLLLLK